MCSLLLLEEFRSLTLDKEAGCANRTPWYITELISNETTKELSPDSPVNIEKDKTYFTISRPSCHTVRNHHFLSKKSTLISREIIDFFGWKTRENVVILDLLAVDSFDFTRKIVQKIFWVKNSWNWIFGQKFDFSNSVQKLNMRKKRSKSRNSKVKIT